MNQINMEGSGRDVFKINIPAFAYPGRDKV
jgi:hypothetical protein